MTARRWASLTRLILPWILLYAGGISSPAEEMPALPTEPPAIAADAAPDNDRNSIVHPPYWLFANYISFDIDAQELVAEGNAEIRSPQGHFFADNIHYNFGANTGYLEGARGEVEPFRFRAAALILDPRDMKHIQQATLTTCTEEHPHYALHARDFVVKPDNRFEARHVSLIFGGRRLFTLPRLAGNLVKDEKTSDRPPLLVGASSLDGVYIGTSYKYPLSRDAGVLLTGRVGTKGIVRGDLSLNQQFSLPGGAARGIVSLRISECEDAENRVLQVGTEEEALESLTVSRIPALQVAVEPVPLRGDLRGFSVRAGAGIGKYRENPTEVTENRSQIWATLRTPIYRIGPTRVSAEVGAQQAFYNRSQHHVGISQLTVESPPEAEHYFNLTYVYRRENGQTPFLFDRVVIPHELSSSIELPIGGSDYWKLGLSNRYDLERGRVRDLGIMAIYSLDCLSYALSYNTVGRTFGVGFVVNAFGSFRKRSGPITFTE
jgi:hypothetical protein